MMYEIKLNFPKGLVICNSAVGRWSKDFESPSQSYRKLFDPSHVLNEKFLTPPTFNVKSLT